MRLFIDENDNAELAENIGDDVLWSSSDDPNYPDKEMELSEIVDYLVGEGIVDDEKDITAIVREISGEPEHFDALGNFDDGEEDYCEFCGENFDACECDESEDDDS